MLWTLPAEGEALRASAGHLRSKAEASRGVRGAWQGAHRSVLLAAATYSNWARQQLQRVAPAICKDSERMEGTGRRTDANEPKRILVYVYCGRDPRQLGWTRHRGSLVTFTPRSPAK